MDQAIEDMVIAAGQFQIAYDQWVSAGAASADLGGPGIIAQIGQIADQFAKWADLYALQGKTEPVGGKLPPQSKPDESV